MTSGGQRSASGLFLSGLRGFIYSAASLGWHGVAS
jgi:hypothetical protein